MKKLLLTCYVLLTLSITLKAQSFQVDGIYYNITSPTTVEVTNSVGGEGGTNTGTYIAYSHITISPTVIYNNTNYDVKAIGNYAFYACSNLQNVSLPESIEVIKERAFSQCNSLNSINLPHSLKIIENYAFEKCTSLKEVILPNSIEFLGRTVFGLCTSLEKVTMPINITTLPYEFFWHCESLQSVVLPKGIKKIDIAAFSSANSINSIVLSDSLEQINGWVFAHTHNLFSITIPSKVREIDKTAFYDSHLESITILAVNPPSSLDGNVFEGIDPTSIFLYVPPGSEEDYRSHPLWKDFKIVAIENYYEYFITKGSPNNFITVWDTENTTNIIIPTAGGGYNYHVYWEQENNPAINGTLLNQTGNATISGLQPNTRYRVEIAGTFPQFYMNYNNTQCTKLRTITQWGTIPWRSMEYAFSGCINLDITASDAPNISNLTSLAYMFSGCSSLTGIGANWHWNTSSVTNMSVMFSGASSFNQPIGNWNTSNVTNMAWMFGGARNFNQPIGNWNTSNVTKMYSMFESAISFNQSIYSWNTSNVTDMSFMFYNAINFNQPIGNWNTSNVTNMSFMFLEAISFNQSIRMWNTANVIDMSYMFRGASSFNQPIGNWNTTNVQNMTEMFYRANIFNQNLGSWDLSSMNTVICEDYYCNMKNIFKDSGMDCTNYSSTLVGWAASPSTPNSITLGADGRTYSSSAVAARNALISKGWTITGDNEANAGILSGTQTICVGNTTSFRSTITGGTWSSSHTNIATVHPTTGVVTGVSAGQATISYTRIVSSGCEAVATRTITINALPTAPTVGTITQPSCTSPTGSVVLSGLPAGSWTITRTPGNITTTGTTTSTTLTGLPAGATYTFTVSNGTCTSASSGNVVINAVPTAPVLAGETAVCVASTANVTPSTAGTWTSSQPAFATVSNAGVVTGVAAGTAVLTYTRTSDGCSATRNITITALPTAPTVGTITQPSCTSPTGSVVLSGLPAGNWTITRTPGNITTTGTTTSTTLTGLPAGATYTFTVSNGTCTSASSGNVVINAVPTAPAIPTIASVTQPSCTVSTGAITITSQSGVEYSINNGTSYQSSPVFIGLLPNAYTLRVRSVGNPTCSTVATNSVSINNVPISTVSVVATAQSIRCHGSADGSIHFTAQGGIGSLTATLRNAQNQIVDTKTVTQNVATSFTNLSADTYTLLITDSNGCTAQPAVNEFIIVEPSPIFWQLPTQTITLCKGQQISYDITQLPSLQATYKWYKNNVLVSSLPTYTLSEKGNYRVVITTASLCEQTHSFDVQASSSIIASEFLMASTAKKNEPVKLINISNAPIETATWVLPNLPAVSFTNKDMYGIDLLFDAFGTYTIGLKTTVGQCELVLYKNIRIVPDNELNDYPQEKEAFLKKFIVSPNPSNGNFEVTIEFSEVTDVVLSIVDIHTGTLMNKRSLKGNHWYKQAYTPFLPQGHYIVYLHTHKAQSAFKLIIK